MVNFLAVNATHLFMAMLKEKKAKIKEEQKEKEANKKNDNITFEESSNNIKQLKNKLPYGCKNEIASNKLKKETEKAQLKIEKLEKRWAKALLKASKIEAKKVLIAKKEVEKKLLRIQIRFL